VLLSGFTKYEQIEPNRWRYTLREGVKFHNGEPWNAEAAKVGIDYNGITTNPGTSVNYTGSKHGELVPGEDMMVDVVCDDPYPIYPRTAIFDKFLAPSGMSQPPKRSGPAILSASALTKSLNTAPESIPGWRGTRTTSPLRFKTAKPPPFSL
jgi:ABC-type transport system substrate-binding protein